MDRRMAGWRCSVVIPRMFPLKNTATLARRWSLVGIAAILTSAFCAESEKTEAAAPLTPIRSSPLLTEELKPVTAFVNQLAAENDGPVLVPIPPGDFTQGTDSIRELREQGPARRVTITRPFFLGATEVTQAQWIAVMGSNPSHFKGDRLPVENVSWEDAMAFCRELTAREQASGRLPAGWEFTLPTEAQWEYACRAGTTGDYAGDLDAMGWYVRNSGGKTHEVGTKQANGWGLFDMHGNVWERCLDFYLSYPRSASAVIDPTGPPPNTSPRGAPLSFDPGRVVRGGAWSGPPSNCRSAFRASVGQGNRRGFGPHPGCFGFRLALVRSS